MSYGLFIYIMYVVFQGLLVTYVSILEQRAVYTPNSKREILQTMTLSVILAPVFTIVLVWYCVLVLNEKYGNEEKEC